MPAQVIQISDVNDALPTVLPMLEVRGRTHTASSLSNARPTVEWPGVFITEYTHPTRNVLFDETRDANPFFHYLEAMWILAGRRDTEFLAHILPSMARYSDNGKRFHAAYGHRLRKHFGFDQVEMAIAVLEKRPTSRQVVMAIWDPKVDLGAETLDVPCNDLVMCKIRDGKLNITVSNRSNDAIWGAYGANVVQFSMLQAYMAARIGCGVGTYTQVSDSMHVYEDTPYWQKHVAGALPMAEVSPYLELGDANLFECDVHLFEQDLKSFFKSAEKAIAKPHFLDMEAVTPAIQDARAMFNALRAHRQHRYDLAGEYASHIIGADWHLACSMWLNRRVPK